MMPGLDGFELLHAIRSNPAVHSTLVILLSARAGEDARTEGMKSGADDYLVKPVSAREVLARIDAHLNLTRMRRESERVLKESRDRLALAQSVARAGSFDLDPKARVVVWSEELQSLYGASQNQREISMSDFAAWILTEDRTRALADFAAGLEKGDVTTQFRIRRPDTGEIRWIE